jgi:hypothetical protein
VGEADAVCTAVMAVDAAIAAAPSNVNMDAASGSELRSRLLPLLPVLLLLELPLLPPLLLLGLASPLPLLLLLLLSCRALLAGGLSGPSA